ncbi:hypothetical protein T10_2782 [Trichinella papuae]|uniref:Uncharacterized protein n=1 Tax=Trichinella papuae TaxID=268474 RepID=A0A0V1MZU4_9BILA|nr:hypothetical protein T10_2782 [Trichinella papuae]
MVVFGNLLLQKVCYQEKTRKATIKKKSINLNKQMRKNSSSTVLTCAKLCLAFEEVSKDLLFHSFNDNHTC